MKRATTRKSGKKVGLHGSKIASWGLAGRQNESIQVLGALREESMEDEKVERRKRRIAVVAGAGSDIIDGIYKLTSIL